MTKRARFIAFDPDAGDLVHSFCQLGATGNERGGGKRQRPGTGAQKIGSGPLGADHKAWCRRLATRRNWRKASPVRLVTACNESLFPFVFGN